MEKAKKNWRDIIETELKKRTGVLDLSECELKQIPSEVVSMEWLTKLDLNNNSINKIEGLEKLKKLEVLHLTGNQIGKIEGLDNLRKLKELSLGVNEIKIIEGLNELKNIRHLSLSHNQIEQIEGLSELKNLYTILLNNNKISKIDSLLGLEELGVLYLRNNQIIEIDGLASLNNLDTVFLEGNQIKSIYPILSLLKKGMLINLSITIGKSAKNFISLTGNPLSDPSIETIEQGNDAIFKYFAEKKVHTVKKLEILKIILVGNSQVGKTNFSQFLREGTISDTTKSTHVLDIQKWDADFLISKNGDLTRLHLFDFGGQDYYHDAHRMYYSYDTAYILLWDTISNEYQEQKELIDGVKDTILYENFPLPYWLQSINYTLDGKFVQTYATNNNENEDTPSIPANASGAPPILVIQNKIDIANGKLNQEELSGMYPNIWGYFGVSLLKKKRTEVLKELLSDYLNSLNLTGRTLLGYQLDIVKHFSDNVDNVLHVYTLPEFKDTCIQIINDASVVFEERDALIMAHILNNTGIVLFHQDETEPLIFSDIAILNDQIKKIMDAARKGNDKGVFIKKNVLKEIEAGNMEKVLQLLSSNKSIIKLNNNEYLAPQFLPTEAEKSIQFFLHTFNHTQMRFVYPAYYHKSILLNLFAEYVGGIKDNFSLSSKTFPFWRNGIIVSKGEGINKEMVFIEFVKNKNNAVINIKTMKGFVKSKLEGEIEKLIDKLNTGWSVTKEVSVDSEVFISIENLKEKFKTKQFEFVEEEKRFRINDFKELVHFDKRPKRLFISYSSIDKEYLKQFITQIVSLRNEGLVETWDDRALQAGEKWDIVINEQLDKADYVILFITANFLNSEYIREVELKKAILDGNRIIPVILDYCTWNYDNDLKEIQVLNKENPLTSYSPLSKGWVDVISEMKSIFEKESDK